MSNEIKELLKGFEQSKKSWQDNIKHAKRNIKECDEAIKKLNALTGKQEVNNG